VSNGIGENPETRLALGWQSARTERENRTLGSLDVDADVEVKLLRILPVRPTREAPMSTHRNLSTPPLPPAVGIGPIVR
jgi:hypothetical protein